MIECSVIMSFRGSKEEMEYVKSSVPVLQKLNPRQIIFGLDSGSKESLVDVINSIIDNELVDENNKYEGKVDFVYTDHGKSDFNMRLAHVWYDCILKSDCNTILILDCDMVINQNILNGYNAIQNRDNGVVFHSGFGKFRKGNLRFKLSRWIELRKKKFQGSGCFFVNKEKLLSKWNVEEFKKIHNGCDGFIFDVAKKYNTPNCAQCDYVYTHDVLGLANILIPPVQFSVGLFAHAKYYRKQNIGKFKLFKPYYHLLVFLFRWAHGFNKEFREGWNWFTDNIDDPISKQALSCTPKEWQEQGTKLVKTIKNWDHHGAGFN